MKTLYYPASERGTKQSDWLKSNFFFSFSDFADPSRSAFGTLFAFNDDYLLPGKGFGIHPHINMEIISFLIQGKMNHKDTLGYSTVIEEGGVQIMSAGSGLRHEEYNIGEEDVNFLQIWIQPKQQNINPRYQQRSFPREKRKNKLQTIVSNEEGVEHCWINQNAKISVGYFDAPLDLTYQFRPLNKCLFIFVITGQLRISDVALSEKDGLGIWDTDNVRLNSQGPVEFLLIETPINQK